MSFSQGFRQYNYYQQQPQPQMQHNPPMISPMSQSSRPRFGYQGLPMYPRPRSSASKPNPSPVGSYQHYKEYDYDMDSSNNSSLYYSANEDSSYASCMDTSFLSQSPHDMIQYEQKTVNLNNKSFTYSNFQKSNLSTSSTPKYNKDILRSFGKDRMEIDDDNLPKTKKAFKRKATNQVPVAKHCRVCNIDFTSDIPYAMHIRGAKHMKKLKGIEAMNSLVNQGLPSVKVDGNTMFKCEACQVFLNSSLQLQTHYEGSKHKNKVKEQAEKGETQQPIVMIKSLNTQEVSNKPIAPPVKRKITLPTLGPLGCDICNCKMNSETQLQQHLASKKHQAKVTGVPLPKKSKNEMDVDCAAEDDLTGANSTMYRVPHLSLNFVRKETL